MVRVEPLLRQILRANVDTDISKEREFSRNSVLVKEKEEADRQTEKKHSIMSEKSTISVV